MLWVMAGVVVWNALCGTWYNDLAGLATFLALLTEIGWRNRA